MEYRYSEYTAVSMFDIINRIIIDLEMRNDDIIAVISPIRFRLGGRPIFMETLSIHISEVVGEIINKPFVNIMFRVLVFS